MIMVTTGNYINVTEENHDGNLMDVFVILNEPNDDPTIEETQIIIDITEEMIKEYSYPDMLVDDFKHELSLALEDASVNCTAWGVQILVSM